MGKENAGLLSVLRGGSRAKRVCNAREVLSSVGDELCSEVIVALSHVRLLLFMRVSYSRPAES